MMKRTFWSKKSTAILIGGVIGGVIGGYFIAPFVKQFVTHKQETQQAEFVIDFYRPERDRQDIIDLFNRNIDWLTTNKNYSPEFMLDTRSPNDYDHRYFGKFHIKVLRQGDTFVGFVGYYMKNFYEGTVLFLAVHEDFRGKHYGERLLRDAIAELKTQGASVITLLTWLRNSRSRALYERVGFVETSHDDAIIYYRYKD